MSILQNYHAATALMNKTVTAIKTDWKESHPDCAFLSEPCGPRGKGGLNACKKRAVFRDKINNRSDLGDKIFLCFRKCAHLAECTGDKTFVGSDALPLSDFSKYAPEPKNIDLIKPQKAEQLKRCCNCKADKPLSEFHNNRQRPDGKYHYCKECQRSRMRQYYRSCAQTRPGKPLPVSGMKLCKMCGVVKNLTEFHKNRREVNGVQSRCKECMKIVNKQYSDKYRSERNA